MGKIEDLAFDSKTLSLIRIYSTGGVVKGAFSLKKVVIPADKIIRVSPKSVIIQDDYIKVKTGQNVVLPETA